MRHIFFTIFLLIATVPLFSQISTISNRILIGARPMGMGEAFVAVADDGNAIYWNPAGLPNVDRYELSATRANLFNSGVVQNYISFLIPNLPYLAQSERFSLGLNWMNLGLSDNDLDFSENMFTFSGGYRLFNRLSLGANIKYFHNNINYDGQLKGKAQGWGYDFGVHYAPLNNLSLAVTIQDLNDTWFRYENGSKRVIYPQRIKYGCAYIFNDLKFFSNPLLALDFDDRIHVGGEVWLFDLLGLRAGLQKDLYQYGEDEVTISCGTSIHYKFMQFDYAYTNSPFLENTSRFAVNLNFNLPPSPVTIESIEVQNIFMSQAAYYEKNPFLLLKLKYEQSQPIRCKIKVRDKQFGISSEKMVTINPQREQSKMLQLEANLPQVLFQLTPASHFSSQLEIMIEPQSVFGIRPEKIVSPDFVIYGPGVINWANGTDQICAFITPNDSTVDWFVKRIFPSFKPKDSHQFINQTIHQAVLIFNSLGETGIKYLRDPNTPFAQSSEGFDNVQYPYKLLSQKSGDCDDTTVLLASLLENVGIQTRIVDIPGHVFLMFNTGIFETEKELILIDDAWYMIYNNSIWLPLETTFIGKSFIEAWQRGAEQYNRFEFDSDFRLIDVHETWQDFQPTQFEHREREIEIESPEPERLSLRLQKEAELFRTYRTQFEQTKYADSPDLKIKNELNVIRILTGRQKDAKQDLKKLLGL